MKPAEPLTPAEVLSEAEIRFDRIRRTVGLFLGPAAALLVAALPAPGLTPEAHRLSWILSLVVIYWVTEAIPIPVTALLGPLLCIVAGVAPSREVLAPFANPIIFLFIGSFFIARAMIVHGLDRRFALEILGRAWIGRTPGRLLLAFGGITGVLSMWISNTAAAAMMLPIAIGILGAVGEAAGRGASAGAVRNYRAALMLMVAYSASVGGTATIIGTPPNLIGVGLIRQQTGVELTFLGWMSFAVPISLVMYGFLFGLLKILHPAADLGLSGAQAFIQSERARLPRWRPGERNAAAAFLTAVTLWITPGLIALAAGTDSPAYRWFDERLPESAVAVLAAILLFLLPVDWKERRFTLDWSDAARIDWGTILLFGGGLSLGGLMFKTGLADALGRGLADGLTLQSVWAVTALGIFLGTSISELTSNTASANMVIPVVISIAVAAGVSPIPPALGACLGASCGFMLPISTPPNAIVYGSGLIPVTRMIRAGLLFDFIAFWIILGGLRILCPLLGYI